MDASILIVCILVVGLIFFSALMRWRKQRSVDNAAQEVVGQRGVVRTAVAPSMPGTAQVAGQLWSIEANESIEPGADVEVIARDGLTLKVKKVTTG
jgi:membrane-bound serine protease (ClpP class)